MAGVFAALRLPGRVSLAEWTPRRKYSWGADKERPASYAVFAIQMMILIFVTTV